MTNNIHVTSLKNTMQVNVSSDMSNYYSKIAKDWAVSNDIVNNEDYSSKYYANKTKITADDALYSIEIEKENVLNEFNNTKLEVITNIQEEGNKQISLAATQAQIATDKANEAVNTLNTRADVSLSNLTEAGKSVIKNVVEPDLNTKTDISQAAAASMPSNKFLDLTFSTNVTYYTAPATGYFNIWIRATTDTSYCFAYVYNSEDVLKYILPMDISRNSGGAIPSLIPVLKGDKLKLEYKAIQTTAEIFRFIYAEGAVND